MPFKTPLPETRNDVEWFRGLLSLSPLFFLKTLAEFGAAKDAAALAHAVALQLELQADPGHQVPWSWTNGDAKTVSVANSCAQALYPCTDSPDIGTCRHDARYGPNPLTSKQKALHERAVALFKAEKKEHLSEYLYEAAKTCVDPQALDEIIVAGASVSSFFSIAVSSYSSAQASIPFHALLSHNAVAFLHLLKTDEAVAKNVTQQIFTKGLSNSIFIKPISYLLTGMNTGHAGLHCLVAVEKFRDLKWSMESLEFRLDVLDEYLTRSASHGSSWDEDKVMFLLGQPGKEDPKSSQESQGDEKEEDLHALPAQSSGIRFDSFDNLPTEETLGVIVTALQCHCWPVVELFLKRLIHLQNKGLLPWAHRECVGKFTGAIPTEDTPSTSTALGVMVSIPENFKFDLNRFGRTYQVIRDVGLLEAEEQAQASKNANPAIHQLASHAKGDYLGILRFLLREGLDVKVKNARGQNATSGLPSTDLLLSWDGVIRSSLAQAAAQKALLSLDKPQG